MKEGMLFDRREVLLTGASAATILLVGARTGVAEAASDTHRLARSQLFDLDWRFRRGEGERLQATDLDRRLESPG
jgi:hypothetical protein